MHLLIQSTRNPVENLRKINNFLLTMFAGMLITVYGLPPFNRKNDTSCHYDVKHITMVSGYVVGLFDSCLF